MAKKLISLLCALALAIALMALPASADEDLFFLALNDTLPAASSQITPIQTGGWIYVPASVFNNRVSGVNFGVYYGFTDNNESLIFYNLSGKTLTFDLVNNTASTSTGESVMPGRPVWRGSTCYVPAYAVCSFFGLSYSFYSTDYGSLLRIKDGNARLSDSAFLSSAKRRAEHCPRFHPLQFLRGPDCQPALVLLRQPARREQFFRLQRQFHFPHRGWHPDCPGAGT